MTEQQVKALKNGALITIKGIDYWGDKVALTRIFKSEYVTSHGYMLGGSLYPFEWITLASDSDYMQALDKAQEKYNKRIIALAQAYAITKSQRRG